MSDLTSPDDVVELARQLISVDSVSPSLVPGAAGEAELAALMATRLTSAGYAVELVPAADDPDRISVVASHTGSTPGPTIALNGHLDTVGVDSMRDPFTPRIDDGRLYGRGSSDMKGGLAALIIAAEQLARDDHPGTVLITCVADEEDASRGALAVLDHLERHQVRPDLCLIAEPTWLNLVTAHRGYAVIEVTLSGAASHSSQPDLGVDAVRALVALLNAVSTADAVIRERPAHPLLGHGSLMATVVRAGAAPFTVAADATATLERRTLPGESGQAALSEVQAVLDVVIAAVPGIHATAALTHDRDAWEADPDGPAAQFTDLLLHHLPQPDASPPAEVGAPYWMESALWQGAGIPAVVCGPAGGGLHAAEEWIEISQLRRFSTAVLAAMRAYLTAA